MADPDSRVPSPLSTSGRHRSRSVTDKPELTRNRSEGWPRRYSLLEVVPEDSYVSKYREIKSDFPDPIYGFGDYFQIEREALALHNQEIQFDNYLKENFKPEKVGVLRDKFLLLAQTVIQDGRLYTVMEKLEENQQVPFLLAILVEKQRAQLDRAHYLTVVADRGHTGRAQSMVALMKQKLVDKVPQTPRSGVLFRSNLSKYKIKEKVVHFSENPRLNRVIPVIDDKSLLMVNRLTQEQLEIKSVNLIQTVEKLAKMVANETKTPFDQVKIQLGPGLFTLDPKKTLFELNIQLGSVLFY